MKRISKIVVCACALIIGTCMSAHAGAPGSSCEDAIPMGTDYSAQVRNGDTFWYSAWTFDLPLTVTFVPLTGASAPAPEVEMDFTCTPGFYSDSILCSFFCKTSGATSIQFPMPHKPSLDKGTTPDGKPCYYLTVGKSYRDLLLQAGISYNLEVYVKVAFKSSGTISLTPDALFTNCVDSAKFMHLGDTVQVQALDVNRHVIVPYIQWQNDTIRYKWTDAQQPCTVAVANKCDFDPSLPPDDDMLDYQVILPGDSLTVTAALLTEYVNNQKDYKNEAGMYFAKFYSQSPGVMKIIKAPRAPMRGNATLLRFDHTYALNANDNAVFAIPDSWNDDTLNTKFVSPTDHMFSMKIATDPDFSEAHTLKTYQFNAYESGHWQGIYAAEMQTFWTRTTEKYLYIRFDCSEATTITPSKWQVDPCITSTKKNFIHSLDTTFIVQSRDRGGFYMFNYAQWVGGDLKLTFKPANECRVFFAADCDITLATNPAEAPNLLFYKKLTSAKNSVTLSADTIASFAERVGPDGYIYARFNHTLSGTFKMTVQSTAPAEADPVYPSATIAVECEGTQVVVKVSEDQHVVITDSAGEIQDQWDAVTGESHSVNLPAGKYTLQGQKEKITINL